MHCCQMLIQEQLVDSIKRQRQKTPPILGTEMQTDTGAGKQPPPITS